MPWYFWAWVGLFVIDLLIAVGKAGQIRGRFDETFILSQCVTYAALIVTFFALADKL